MAAAAALLVALLVVALLVVAAAAALRRPGGSGGDAGAGPAARLAAAGWVLYTLPGCGYCARQLEALGVETYPAQVVCGRGRCAGVGAYPTWKNTRTGEVRTGLQTAQQLGQM